MRRFIILTALTAAAALVAPLALNADDHRDEHHAKRYYDRDGHDYHSWDDHEDRAYRIYLGEQHREYSDFSRAKAAQQREYFRWRHEHPDKLIFGVEIR
jgi:hypothetical protein